jgi:hypothetical protein
MKLDSKPDGVELGDGSIIDIAGKGKIVDTEIYYIPSLNKTVLAADVVQSNGRITILRNNKLTIYRNDCDFLSKLIELEELSIEKDLIVVDVSKENGIYPVTDKQVKRLCTNDDNEMDNTISSLLYNDSDDDHIKNNNDDETAVLPTEKKVTFAKDLENVIDINSTEPTTRLPVIDFPSYKNRGVAVGDDNVGINSSSYFGVENTKLRDENLLENLELGNFTVVHSHIQDIDIHRKGTIKTDLEITSAYNKGKLSDEIIHGIINYCLENCNDLEKRYNLI